MIRPTYQTLQALADLLPVRRRRHRPLRHRRADAARCCISARELNSSELPSQSWVNEHLVYTHGYGVGRRRRATRPTSDGDPDFLRQRHPVPKDDAIDARRQGRARSTSARTSPGYAIVDAKQQEFDYPHQGSGATRTTRYTGDDGVELSNILRARRVRAALQRPQPADLRPDHGDVEDPATSATSATGSRSSRRSSTSTPTRTRSIADGKVVWVLDGYTTTDQYPYSQSTSRAGGHRARPPVQLRAQLGEGDGRRLRRHGQVLRDRPGRPGHPAYQKAFPDLFSPIGEMPRGAASAPALPGGPVPRPDGRRSRKYHVTETRALLPGQRALAALARPGSGRARPAHAREPDRRHDHATDRAAPSSRRRRAAHGPVLPATSASR